MPKPVFSMRGWARGMVTNGDSADFQKDSVELLENARYDLTGDLVARPGTGIAPVGNVTVSGHYGPFEYYDDNKTAVIFAREDGTIHELVAGSLVQVAAFPSSTSGQIIRGLMRDNRLRFVNGVDRPYYLRWNNDSSAWEFNTSGIVGSPTPLTASPLTQDTFAVSPSTAAAQFIHMAYRHGSSDDFMIRSAATGGLKSVNDNWTGDNYTSATGVNAYGPYQDGEIAYRSSDGLFIVPGGFNDLEDGIRPLAASKSRVLFTKNFDTDTESADYTFQYSNVGNVDVMWAPGSSMCAPRSWGPGRVFMLLFCDARLLATFFASGTYGTGWSLVELETTSGGIATIRELYYRNVTTNTGGPYYEGGFGTLYSSTMTTSDEVNVIYALEQPGVWNGVNAINKNGNCQLVKYNVGENTREIVYADCGFQHDRKNRLIYRHGSNSPFLYYMVDGADYYRKFDITSGRWVDNVIVGEAMYAPFEIASPENDYFWYITNQATGHMARRLIEGGQVPGGLKTYWVGYTLLDNVGNESSGSTPVQFQQSTTGEVTLTNFATTVTGSTNIFTKVRIYMSPANGNNSLLWLVDTNGPSAPPNVYELNLPLTSVDVSVDDSFKESTRVMPTGVDRGAPPLGATCLASFLDRMFYAVGSTLYWSPAGDPDNIPPANQQPIGLDRNSITALIDMPSGGLLIAKRRQFHVLPDDPAFSAPQLRASDVGFVSQEAVVVGRKFGVVGAGERSLYAFDAFNATAISEPVNGTDMTAFLSGSVRAIVQDPFILFAKDDGECWIMELVDGFPGLRFMKDQYPFGIDYLSRIDRTYTQGAYNVAPGIYAFNNSGGTSTLHRLFNSESNFDNAEWGTTAYDQFGVPSAYHVARIVTQDVLVAPGHEVAVYSVYVDSEVTA